MMDHDLNLPLGDHLTGILRGLVAGDRIGGPSQMAQCLADSLAAQSGFDPEDVFSRYLGWWCESGFDTGPVAARVFDLVSSGSSVEEAVHVVHSQLDGQTAGCNPAHRIAPLAACLAIADEDLDAVARDEARLTHFHPLAGEVSAVVATLCRRLIRGVPWEDSLAGALAGRSTEILRQEPLSRGGFAPEVLRTAIFFVSSSRTFDAALTHSMEFAGPDNYCPVLVGSIGGARWLHK